MITFFLLKPIRANQLKRHLQKKDLPSTLNL